MLIFFVINTNRLIKTLQTKLKTLYLYESQTQIVSYTTYEIVRFCILHPGYMNDI